MDWWNLRQEKGQNVQDYTQDFRKMAPKLGILLYTKEIVLRYIGGLRRYLRHTILMFNPTNIHEVFVQDTNIESEGGNARDIFLKESSHQIEGKKKGKEKMKWITIVNSGRR